jgi:bifunctional UDP-N-acetylglucosamine pyrophosphorylase/glucosamine-1-phosphate N-acetyltransferase
VAPVTIGDGAYTGAGTVVRKDVPAGSLGVTVAPQRNIEGWVESHRPGTDAAVTAVPRQGAPGEDAERQ